MGAKFSALDRLNRRLRARYHDRFRSVPSSLAISQEDYVELLMHTLKNQGVPIFTDYGPVLVVPRRKMTWGALLKKIGQLKVGGMDCPPLLD